MDETDGGGNRAATERPPEVERAREEVIDAMARSAEIYGLKRSYGRIYGVLFFADEPMSLDELATESEYAKSTVSAATSAMESFHLVRRRSLPGEGKKAFFEAERDFWYVFQQLLDNQVRREIAIMTRALDGATERLEDVDGGETELERVRTLRRLYGRCERAVDLATGLSLDRLVSVMDRLRGGD